MTVDLFTTNKETILHIAYQLHIFGTQIASYGKYQLLSCLGLYAVVEMIVLTK